MLKIIGGILGFFLLGVYTVIAQGSGNSLDFDGANDYMRVSNDPSLNLSGNISMEMWFKGRGADHFDGWVGIKGGVGFAYAGTGGASDHKVYWTISGVGLVTTTSTFTDDSWHHIAGTYDGSFMSIYVDGVLENQIAASGTYNMSAGDMFFAVRGDFVNYVNISLDDFRIWNSARSNTQIRDNMCENLVGDESGLVSWWRFDEGSGTIAADSGPNSNNGTLN